MPEKAIIRAAENCKVNMLALLTEAIVKVKNSINLNDELESIELFKMEAKSLNCFTEKYNFESDLARFVYFNKKDSYLDYVPFEDFKTEVIMISGVPGSGKDSFYQKNLRKYPMVSLDDIRRKLRIDPKKEQGRVVQEAKDLAKQYLRAGQTFVWNATNISFTIRRELISLFLEYKAKVKIIYIETDYKTLLERNKKREFQLPIKVLEKLIDRLDVPHAQEAHSVEYIV